MRIRPVVPGDHQAIAAIYNHYVSNTTVTFEETPLSGADVAARVADVAGWSLPWLVGERDGEVLGYAYVSPWKARAAYRFSVESHVYVRPDALRRGLGAALYQELFSALRRGGTLHAVIGGIALPNHASVALHERLGMTKVAHFKEVGFKHGRWIDVGYWQLVFPGGTSPPEGY